MSERNEKVNTILDSKIAKFLAVVLLCALGTFGVYQMYGYSWLDSNRLLSKSYSSQEFEETEMVQNYVNSYLTYEMYDRVFEYPFPYSDASFSKDPNIQYQILKYDPQYKSWNQVEYDKDKNEIVPVEKDKQVKLAVNASNAKHLYCYRFTEDSDTYFAEINPKTYDIDKAFLNGHLAGYDFIKNSYSQFYNLPDGDGKYFLNDYHKNYDGFVPDENFEVYQIFGGTRTDMIQDGTLYSMYNTYQAFMPEKENMIFYLLITFVSFVAVLCFSMSSAGHKKDYPGIYTNWFDKIPYEIMSVITVVPGVLLGVLGGKAGLSSISHYSGYVIQRDDFVIMITLFVMGSLLVLSWLLSTSRRCKSHMFFKTTFFYYLWKWFTGLFKAVSVTPYTYMVLGGVFVLAMFLNPNHSFLFWMIIFSGAIYLANVLKNLETAGKEIAKGNLDYEIKGYSTMPAPFKNHADNLMSIRNGMRFAINKEMQSERMKTELITNVSHDIKTPLTSIINYVDLLQKAHTEEEKEEYLEVLERQSIRLKKLIEDLIEASKASTGNLKVNLMPLDLQELVDQAVAEYSDKFATSSLQPIVNVSDAPISVYADGKLLWRVLSNLFSNTVKYAMPQTRIYIDAKRVENDMVEISVKNISKDALNISKDELMERFVRGDESRSTEGSGLGLNIAQSLMELMKGNFDIQIDGDLFKAIILVPECKHQNVSDFQTKRDPKPVVKHDIPEEFKIKNDIDEEKKEDKKEKPEIFEQKKENIENKKDDEKDEKDELVKDNQKTEATDQS